MQFYEEISAEHLSDICFCVAVPLNFSKHLEIFFFFSDTVQGQLTAIKAL